ncbi:hypothetical protein CEXT_459471 [Caerostris extrusa]|uniref:Uncharacterized protein n=1 Tax=Caerostris extrusa TaxID=172846 RepID=A0AAV4YA67_CAEEX|nr:hypothetical protein CEXT_459471 [Caerostris extrusa]
MPFPGPPSKLSEYLSHTMPSLARMRKDPSNLEPTLRITVSTYHLPLPLVFASATGQKQGRGYQRVALILSGEAKRVERKCAKSASTPEFVGAEVPLPIAANVFRANSQNCGNQCIWSRGGPSANCGKSSNIITLGKFLSNFS